MHANSTPVASDQSTIHQHLSTLVDRHARSVFQKPISSYNQTAFEQAIAAWHAQGAPALILDTGCGVGLSTLHLAANHPDHFVIGVDQSADRCTRNTKWEAAMPDNLIRIRADMVDFWRLLLQHKIYPAKQYLLYPNPWPKAAHLSRRWHGHAVFPTIVALGGEIECRSNWKIYVEEFAAALNRLSRQVTSCEIYIPENIITPFEQKYLASGHALWRCKTQLAPKNLESHQIFGGID